MPFLKKLLNSRLFWIAALVVLSCGAYVFINDGLDTFMVLPVLWAITYVQYFSSENSEKLFLKTAAVSLVAFGAMNLLSLTFTTVYEFVHGYSQQQDALGMAYVFFSLPVGLVTLLIGAVLMSLTLEDEQEVQQNSNSQNTNSL